MRGGFPNLRHIRVFLETARTGSVTLAADLCHLSQPAATQAITSLEKDVGTSLLKRDRRQAVLNNCGELFAKRAQRALSHLKDGSYVALKTGGGKTQIKSDFDKLVTASQLRNLIAIANTGSFSVAANALGLSQPTVHRTARSLEAVAGLPFFAASPSGVQLTAAAEAFVIRAKLAETELRQGLEEISHELGHDCGNFVLGSLPLARTTIVPKAIHSMVSQVSGFQIRVLEGRYSGLLRSLREGDLDCLIGALRNPAPADDVEQEFLFQDALAVVAHPSHPLAKSRGLTLTLEDTLDFPWIAPPKETPAGQFLFEKLRIQDRPETPVRVVSSSLAVLRGVLAQGNYVSIVSRHQVHVDAQLGSIIPLNIRLSGHKRNIGLTFRRNWTPTKTQQQFIDFLRQQAKLNETPC